MKTEQRRFNMHANLLFDVIRRQAGSLDQAVREGVMNAVDARATHVALKVTPSEIVLEDNGTGFKDRRQIETCFETFGQPHEAGEKKVFGAFRMGRGQLFAYGKNVWSTGNFVMDVDIANMGLDYELREVPAYTPGCTVRVIFYKKLTPYDVENLISALKNSLKWLPTKVFVNGSDESISTDPATRPEGYWTYVTDDAYVKLTPSDSYHNTVSVYNMGVYVTAFGGRWPHNGVVVSKKALTLNFARNDIMQTCPVWNAVKGFVLVERAAKASSSKPKTKAERSKTLRPSQRDELARQIVEGECELDAREQTKVRLIQDTRGRHWSARMLSEVIKEHRGVITVAAEKDPRAAKLRDNRMAFPVTPRTRNRFLASTAGELAAAFKKLWPGLLNVRGVEVNELWSESYEQVKLLGEEELKPLERAVALTIRDHMDRLHGGPRQVRFAVSYGPEHWTDGYSYVGLDREWLVRNNVNVRGWLRLGRIVQHELLHEQSSLAKEHKHDAEFYEDMDAYYDHITDFAVACFQTFPHRAGQLGVSADDCVSLQQASAEAESMSTVDELAAELLGATDVPHSEDDGPADPSYD